MNDIQIIELYFRRNEQAIAESQSKYGRYCTVIANNILFSKEDSEECVNDTWLQAWNTIPPKKPSKLSLFFGKITRNLAINMYRKNSAEKRGGHGTDLCLEELEECVGKGESIGDALELKEALDRFMETLKPKPKKIFMTRYWYMLPIKDTAKACGVSEGAAKMSLKRTRTELKEFLEKEGITV